MGERDYQLPWKRGIGNESRKIWDANGRLVCTMETAGDSTFLVESVNGHNKLEEENGLLWSLVDLDAPANIPQKTRIRLSQLRGER